MPHADAQAGSRDACSDDGDSEGRVRLIGYRWFVIAPIENLIWGKLRKFNDQFQKRLKSDEIRGDALTVILLSNDIHCCPGTTHEAPWQMRIL